MGSGDFKVLIGLFPLIPLIADTFTGANALLWLFNKIGDGDGEFSLLSGISTLCLNGDWFAALSTLELSNILLSPECT